MPSHWPAFAISTARSIARPAIVPASATLAPARHEPTTSSAWQLVPVGPTAMKDASPAIAGSASAAATISGPMPRGSPRVIARRGLSWLPLGRGATIEDYRRRADAIFEHL